MKEYLILSRDLQILEKMSSDMDAYLKSESMHWVIGNGDVPRLTIGGYLMRQERLIFLCEKLDVEDQQRLQKGVEQFRRTLKEKVVLFEKRAHQELHARLGEWVGYLRSLKKYGSSRAAKYASVVDTRLVIEVVVDKLHMPPYQLQSQIPEELDTLDQNLRDRWQEGEFVLPAVWQPVYPRQKYWWLYGHPK